MAEEHKRQFILPPSLAEPADISRAARELEAVDDFIREAEIRYPGTAATLPRISKGLQDMADLNGLKLLENTDRAKAGKLLEALTKTSPVMHISFAAEPTPTFVTTIITELRKRIHPYVLVQIGLQPALAGGCMVRTENKMFDFSLRQHLQKNKGLLAKIFADLNTKEDAKIKPDQQSQKPPTVEDTRIQNDEAALQAQLANPVAQPAPETT